MEHVFKGHLHIPDKLSLYDRCPFITGSLAYARQDTVLRKCSLYDQKMSSHESVSCRQVSLYKGMEDMGREGLKMAI